jgi:Na+-transporting NADH:ubiquinone oxidoreductase subunit NqrB
MAQLASRLASFWNWFRSDARHGQIATLGTLLIYGMARLGFDITVTQALVTIGFAVAAQTVAEQALAGHAPSGHAPSGRVASGLKSALISSLSLCLLLRTDTLAMAGLAAVLAVGSKFVLRIGGKHVFNPTNIAIVLLMLVSNDVWVSPGQWGSHAALAFLLASAGLLVVHRAARADVTLAFIVCWTALLAARSLSLNEPMTIPLHRLESGAFLLFSFFMISDPRTTPDTRAGRIIFAGIVALGAAYVQFKLFRTNGFVSALACASPLVPLLDRLLPGRGYSWASVPAPDTPRLPASTGIPIGAFAFDRSVHHVHGGSR